MTTIIDGSKIAAEIKNENIIAVSNLKNRGIIPGLAMLLIGDDSASDIYVKSKEKMCADIGINSIILRKDKNTTEQEILQIINEWNNDNNIHGILVQLPLPKHINETKILLSINPIKDVDGLHPENMGRLVEGLPCHISCTPQGIHELLIRYNIETKGKHCVVLGRSNIVGKPIANIMLQKSPTANSIVTICHTGTDDTSKYTKMADILIVAVGIPEIIKSKDIKDGVVIIDVGINRVTDATNPKGYRVCGDVDYADVFNKSSTITPVPGGVGPMTIAMLMRNTIRSAKKEVY